MRRLFLHPCQGQGTLGQGYSPRVRVKAPLVRVTATCVQLLARPKWESDGWILYRAVCVRVCVSAGACLWYARCCMYQCTSSGTPCVPEWGAWRLDTVCCMLWCCGRRTIEIKSHICTHTLIYSHLHTSRTHTHYTHTLRTATHSHAQSPNALTHTHHKHTHTHTHKHTRTLTHRQYRC